MRTKKLLTTLAIIAVVLIAGCNKNERWGDPFDPAISDANLLKIAENATSPVDLGTAATFAVLGGSTVTNVPENASLITGDAGVSPGSELTGFDLAANRIVYGTSPVGTVTPGLGIVTGTIYAGGDVAAQAHADAQIAYDYLVNQMPTTFYPDIVYPLDRLVLTPGIYNFPSAAILNVGQTLTLDFRGNSDALFIFQLGSTLKTMSGSNIIAINTGTSTCLGANVFWAVGSSATIDGEQFIGTVIAQTSIGMTNTGNDPAVTNVSGRMLALDGAVTMVYSNISVCEGSGGTVKPPKPCRDFVTGGGWIKGNSDDSGLRYDKNNKATFGVSGGIKNGRYWGQLSYNDHGRDGISVKSTGVTAYIVIDSVTRQIEGNARVGRSTITYTVVVKDIGEPGRYDSFSLELSNGYSASGTLGGGNIQLHKECGESHIKHDMKDNSDKEDYYDKDEIHGNNCSNENNWNNDHEWNNDHDRR